MPTSRFTTESHTDLSRALEAISDPSFSSLQLFYRSHPQWPLSPDVPPSELHSESPRQKPIHIAILDSSFNPPTRAHLAIAHSAFPAPHASHEDAGSSQEEYSARLLLLSARNVDKTLKPGDATLAQRVEMMQLLAEEMETLDRANGIRSNIAVGSINQPTFVGKSGIVLAALQDSILPPLLLSAQTLPNIRLSFLIGTDTLTRLFMPKYYMAASSPSPASSTVSSPSENMHNELSLLFRHDRSRIVSAHRGTSETARQEEEVFIAKDQECQLWLKEGGIRFLNVGDEERDMSSTDVRRAVKGLSSEERKESDAAAESLKRLVVAGITDYVVEKGLYRL